MLVCIGGIAHGQEVWRGYPSPFGRAVARCIIPAAIGGTATVCSGATTALSDATTGGIWSSDNSGVATVNGSGVVTGVSAGSVVISYSTGAGCVAVKTVTVNAIPNVYTQSYDGRDWILDGSDGSNVGYELYVNGVYNLFLGTGRGGEVNVEIDWGSTGYSSWPSGDTLTMRAYITATGCGVFMNGVLTP